MRGLSRFEETPAEVVIELRDDGYHLVGSTADAKREDRQEVIAEILTDNWLTPEKLREQWPKDTIPRPGNRTFEQDLKHGYEAGKWQRDGKGVKGDPFRYRFDSRTPPPLGERNESNGATGARTLTYELSLSGSSARLA